NLGTAAVALFLYEDLEQDKLHLVVGQEWLNVLRGSLTLLTQFEDFLSQPAFAIFLVSKEQERGAIFIVVEFSKGVFYKFLVTELEILTLTSENSASSPCVRSRTAPSSCD